MILLHQLLVVKVAMVVMDWLLVIDMDLLHLIIQVLVTFIMLVVAVADRTLPHHLVVLVAMAAVEPVVLDLLV